LSALKIGRKREAAKAEDVFVLASASSFGSQKRIQSRHTSVVKGGGNQLKKNAEPRILGRMVCSMGAIGNGKKSGEPSLSQKTWVPKQDYSIGIPRNEGGEKRRKGTAPGIRMSYGGGVRNQRRRLGFKKRVSVVRMLRKIDRKKPKTGGGKDRE